MSDGCAWAGRIGIVLMALALSAGNAAAQETQEEDGAAAPEAGEGTPLQEVEVVIVTGTRLQGGDETARVEVITAEDIARQGLTSFEDVVRSIPQNFSTINSSNTQLIARDVLDVSLGTLGLGAATANLRGFGSQNTLVLVNGKRLAGIQNSAEQLAANLNDIPAGAIDRVEVSLDGGSAVYGSDAVAGVINVITKRDFKGVTVGGKVENSSTGAHARSIDLYGGTGWGSGNVSVILTLNESDPVKSARTGWTSNDYSARYGGDQRYNLIGTSYAPDPAPWDSIAICSPDSFILPPGNDGRNARPGDFVAPQPSDYLDIIREDITSAVERRSLTTSLLQNFGAREQIQLPGGPAMVRDRDSRLPCRRTIGVSSIRVPASNAFNNFGRNVWVRYSADTEVEQGILPQVEQTDSQEQLRYVLSATYAFNENLRVEFDYTKAASSSEGDQYMFAPPSVREDDDARYRRLTDLVASSDPSVALNLFGDGTGQNATIAEFYRSILERQRRNPPTSHRAEAVRGTLGASGWPGRFRCRHRTSQGLGRKAGRGLLYGPGGVGSPDARAHGVFPRSHDAAGGRRQ